MGGLLTVFLYHESMFPDRVRHVRPVETVYLGEVSEEELEVAAELACSIQEPTQGAKDDTEFQTPGSHATALVYFRTNPGIRTGDVLHGLGDHAGRSLAVVMVRAQKTSRLSRWRCDCNERR